MLFTLPDCAALPDDVESLKDLLLQVMRHASIAAQEADSIERLELQLVALRRLVFGTRSERLVGQADLFALPTALPMPPALKDRVTYERHRRGRPALPADLPPTHVQYDLDDAEKALFARVLPIGEQVNETLQFTPARLTVIEHARLKYRCRRTSWAPRLVFGDDTTLRLIMEGVARKTVTARLWGYISAGETRNYDRAWAPYPKPVIYEFTTDRGGEHPRRFLARYRGFLQADDYGGYHTLFAAVGCCMQRAGLMCRRQLNSEPQFSVGANNRRLRHAQALGRRISAN